ncbi:MAG: hypothetical protein Alis3KO_28850 [Aliiglaciecola sp.]
MKTNLLIKTIGVFFLAICAGCNTAFADEENSEAKVIGMRHLSIHILELEKTIELYRDILGMELTESEVLQIPGIEGMLVLKFTAGDLIIALSLPATSDAVGPIGNTNHNHFMLKVNNIGPIGDKLKQAGYSLENDNYVNDLYTFFTGPNGEIIGLSSY